MGYKLRTRTGLCWHCGKPDVALTREGYIERHYRADYRLDVDPGNELCFGGVSGGLGLRPGEPCWEHGPDNPNCRAGALP